MLIKSPGPLFSWSLSPRSPDPLWPIVPLIRGFQGLWFCIACVTSSCLGVTVIDDVRGEAQMPSPQPSKMFKPEPKPTKPIQAKASPKASPNQVQTPCFPPKRQPNRQNRAFSGDTSRPHPDAFQAKTQTMGSATVAVLGISTPTGQHKNQKQRRSCQNAHTVG